MLRRFPEEAGLPVCPPGALFSFFYPPSLLISLQNKLGQDSTELNVEIELIPVEYWDQDGGCKARPRSLMPRHHQMWCRRGVLQLEPLKANFQEKSRGRD